MTTSTGLMLPSSSLDLGSQWHCLGVGARGSGCGAVMEAEAVVRLEEQVEKALEEVRICFRKLPQEVFLSIWLSCFLLKWGAGGVMR